MKRESERRSESEGDDGAAAEYGGGEHFLVSGGDRGRLETVTNCRDYLFHEFSVMI